MLRHCIAFGFYVPRFVRRLLRPFVLRADCCGLLFYEQIVAALRDIRCRCQTKIWNKSCCSEARDFSWFQPQQLTRL